MCAARSTAKAIPNIIIVKRRTLGFVSGVESERGTEDRLLLGLGVPAEGTGPECDSSGGEASRVTEP